MIKRVLQPALLVVVLTVFPPVSGMRHAQENLRGEAQVPSPSYENSIEGFSRLIQDVVSAAKDNDQARLLALTGTMTLPESDTWFKNVFGESYGLAFAQDYTKTREDLAVVLASNILALVRDGFLQFDVRRFAGNCDEGVNQGELSVLIAREKSQPLDVVRFHNGGVDKTLRFFAFADGGFRFLGTLRALRKMNPPVSVPAASIPNSDDPPVPTRIQLPADVAIAKLLNRGAPIYPDEARRNHIEGTVKVRAIIARDGTVFEMDFVSGPCPLAEAAFRAVGQWRFSPTTLNGIPVEVEAIFDVTFKMKSK
jgi:TonB family protein